MLPIGTEEDVYLGVREGWLEIRGDGSVWRVAQRRKSRWDGTVTVRPVEPHRIDAPVGAGYRLVKFTVDGKQVSTPAHRLVWRHCNGPIPAGLTVNHKNGDKADNRLKPGHVGCPKRCCNLELATYAEQTRHALQVLQVGRVLHQEGEANAMSKLTEKAVREIRRRRAAGERLKTIAEAFGVSDRAVSKIARGDRWKGLLG